MNAPSAQNSSLAVRLSMLISMLTALSMTTGCTFQQIDYVPAPSGGYYLPQNAQSWSTNWGLVKSARPRAMAETDSFWRGDGVSGSPRIVIDLSDQKASFYKGSTLVGVSPICSGSEQFPTPKGRFSIIEKDEDHYSSVYGDYVDSVGNILQTQIDNRKDPRPPGAKFDGAKMFWFMRIVGGVGMHEGYLPGYADSHGCIRLPSNMARIFYQNARLGTPVSIVE